MIVGTAGHVDHGKTSLVKALTGVDTDRLPEEKRRGITLELGFAPWKLPSGRTVGLVDVPGHERFVRAMVAGAGGVDVAVLVIASDEGVMPQTREHVDICGVLGVKRGVVALTKADVLPALPGDWKELLEADVRALVKGTFLDGAPWCFVSAHTGEGLAGLAAEVDRLTDGAELKSADGPLFLPVDRAFSVKGFGCVVTGSLLQGTLRVDDEVLLSPDGLAARVRSLEVHGERVPAVKAGSRVAANLTGVDTAAVRRCAALVRPGSLLPTRTLDVELTLLATAAAPLPRRSRRLVSLGTDTRLGVVQLLGKDRLEPGDTAFAQLRFGAPLAALPGQHFVLRGTDAAAGRGATVGGGRVLVLGSKRRRRDAQAQVAAFAEGGLDVRAGVLLDAAGYGGLLGAELEAQLAAPRKDVARALEVGAAQGRWALVDRDARRYVSAALLSALERKLVATVAALHDADPEREGVGREELRQRVGAPAERAFDRALGAACSARQLEQVKDVVRVPGRGRSFSVAAQAQQDALVAALERAGLTPPTVAELAERLALPAARVTELLQALAAQGVVVRADALYFHAAPLAQLRARLVDFLQQHGELTTQAFKELTQVSRKYLIPLAEHFDATKVTLRVGDKRVLRRRD